MALSSRLNVTTLGGSKELAAASESVYISSPGLRSADLSYSVPINPYSSSFHDLRTSPPNRRLMELPQPQHSSEGSKTPHDFLSLYGSSNSLNRAAEHRSNQGLSTTYLTTQDFLQPLERGGRTSNNNNSRGSEVSSAEGSAATSTSSVEHVLPGGIGTYSISHISAYGQSNGKSEAGPPPPPSPMVHVNATEAKPEIAARVTSAMNNYGVGGGPAFALWEERVRVPEGNRTTDPHAKSDAAKDYGYWPAARSKTDLFLAKNAFSLNSVDVIQQPIPSSSKQRPQTGQGFVEMMKSMKPISEDDEDEDDEYVDRNRENRKEILSHKGEAPSKVDGKSNDQRANTPRSKHSATEQRRRSKINDRFQTLRDLVPHSDQKRDKASFLLEVIEYIQSLQEKVRKYEATEQSWNQERMKTMVWDLCKKSPVHGELPVDGCRTIASAVLDSKQNSEVAEPNKPRTPNATMHDEMNTAGTAMHPNSQSLMQTNKSTQLSPGCQTYREKENSGVFNKPVPLTLSMQQSMYSPFGRNLTHSVHPKTQAVSEIHSLPTVPGITSGCMAVNAFTFDREKDGNSTASVLLPRFQENTVNVAKTMSGLETQWSERRSSQPSSIPQDSGQNGGIPVKDENLDTKSACKPDQYSNICLNNRLSQSVSQSEAELASRQLQPQSSSPDQHRVNESQLPANEQEQLVIQGGVINVSSVYSQGLLDTLTQALRSSGLDLSQANISVQIDLGRQSGTVGVTTNAKEHSHNQEESSQNHQLQGQVRAAEQTSECEPPHKRPKIERDL
ncbi:hypothetical protein SUGI_0320220 [Cryptomeria japonica]|uniref:transcription factor BIM1 n=1 Tax=Cryptomeria japonica TaxID=3369 RepID=UPI002408CA5E|nr:transcription factor BIM1 [Cryptomeria japonica]XP_057815730.2 transcription factor BIM1 [Cryptomeria japonica]GLJ18128.1 hypothetical protein SUGI_0320220 [Cryptomeria japonica]